MLLLVLGCCLRYYILCPAIQPLCPWPLNPPTPPSSPEKWPDQVAIAGTINTHRYEYTRLSSSSRHHPLARVAALSAAEVGPGNATGPNDKARPTAEDGAWTEADQSATAGPEVVLLRRGRDLCGGDGGGCRADPTTNHAGFSVRSDGTAGKLYGDLGGSVKGVTFVHVSCLTTDRQREPGMIAAGVAGGCMGFNRALTP